MTDELLPYYNAELAFIRRLGAEFARAHPKIAARLQLGPESAEDPHVERLIEAFAYLNARIRHKLDDDFPEIAEAMLGVLYPHYQAPVPSMAIVRFALDRSQGQLLEGYRIPREAVVETDPIEGEPCKFSTCYPVTLWPIELTGASLVGRPFSAPAIPETAASVAVLRLELECFAPEVNFSQLPLESLRFYLRGPSQYTHPLYELIFQHTRAVALASSPRDARPVVLRPDCLRPVGFERDEGMLPYSPQSFLGYRLLTEYFAFPEKFLLFDLAGLGGGVLSRLGRRLEIYLFLAQTSRELEQNIGRDTFQLGCTPIVNLFRHRAEPIALTETETTYRIIPDVRRPRANEIYAIDKVTAVSPANEQEDYLPFYSFKHHSQQLGQRRFWYAVRRRAERVAGQVDEGTELHLSFVDLGLRPASPAQWTVHVDATCLNRDLPYRLPFGGGQPQLRLAAGGPVALECLTHPTPTLRPALRHGVVWRLISHLTLNHLSLADYEDGADALREILRLYDFNDSAEVRAVIDGILSVRTRRVVGRLGHDIRGGFCRGIEVNIQFDEDRFVGTGVYLFAAVLERFLALYCSINSFTRTVATTNKREGELARWPPRSGEMTLL